MKSLITGGAGFIGSHLAERLLSQGEFVTVIDDLSTGRIENLESCKKYPSFNFVEASVMDQEALQEVSKGCDEIYHLAAAVGVKYVVENPLESLQINIKGTERVLDLADELKVPVFLASTSEIYGKNEILPLSEDDDRVLGSVQVSRWGYSTSKAVDEFLALAYFKEKGLPVIIGRFFNTVGPRQRGEYGMVVPRFIDSALKGRDIVIYGDGQQTRCFSHVNDVVGCVISLMGDSRNYGQVYNIGSDEEVSIRSLAERIIKKTNSPSRIKYISLEEAFGPDFEEMKVRRPNLAKIKKAIGFVPHYNLDSTIDDIIEYFKFQLERMS